MTLLIYSSSLLSANIKPLPIFPLNQAEKYFDLKYKKLKNYHWQVDQNSTIKIVKDKKEKTVNLIFNKKVNIGNYFKTQDKFVLMGRDKIYNRAPDWIYLGIPSKGIYIDVSPGGRIEEISWITPWKDTRLLKTFEAHLQDIDNLFTIIRVNND